MARRKRKSPPRRKAVRKKTRRVQRKAPARRCVSWKKVRGKRKCARWGKKKPTERERRRKHDAYMRKYEERVRLNPQVPEDPWEPGYPAYDRAAEWIRNNPAVIEQRGEKLYASDKAFGPMRPWDPDKGYAGYRSRRYR